MWGLSVFLQTTLDIPTSHEIFQRDDADADARMIHALNSNVSDHIAIVTGPAWELSSELTLQVWWSVSRSFEVREPYSYEVVSNVCVTKSWKCLPEVQLRLFESCIIWHFLRTRINAEARAALADDGDDDDNADDS